MSHTRLADKSCINNFMNLFLGGDRVIEFVRITKQKNRYNKLSSDILNLFANWAIVYCDFQLFQHTKQMDFKSITKQLVTNVYIKLRMLSMCTVHTNINCFVDMSDSPLNWKHGDFNMLLLDSSRSLFLLSLYIYSNSLIMKKKINR